MNRVAVWIGNRKTLCTWNILQYNKYYTQQNETLCIACDQELLKASPKAYYLATNFSDIWKLFAHFF